MGWRVLQRGDILHLGDVEIDVCHPPRPEWERQRVRNEDSVVLDIRYRDVSLLLAGDIGAEAWPAVTSAVRASRLRVLKVPHHGSWASNPPRFITQVAPTLAIVSVGRGNRFGHPDPGVIHRYQATGAEVLRTDEDGAITLETDGTSVDVTTFAGRRSRFQASPMVR
jgi:competence protein ComEC